MAFNNSGDNNNFSQISFNSGNSDRGYDPLGCYQQKMPVLYSSLVLGTKQSGHEAWVNGTNILANHPSAATNFEMFYKYAKETNTGSAWKQYYSNDLMFGNEKSRTEFVEPDLKPLPNA